MEVLLTDEIVNSLRQQVLAQHCHLLTIMVHNRPSSKSFLIVSPKQFLTENYPSIHFLNPSVGSRGGWSLSQRSSGERWGTPWTGRQSITGPHTRSHSLLRTILETPINLTCMFLDCGRKPEYPERTHTYTGKGPSRELNLEPSHCEATVLTTTPPST